MTKISEAIMDYGSIRQKEAGYYFGLVDESEKIYALRLVLEAIGDVELSDKYLETFACGFRRFPFNTSREQMSQEIRIIYELSKDADMTIKELAYLIISYHPGLYTLMYEKIKELITAHKDLESGLRLIKSQAYKYCIDAAKKLEYLKEEYSKDFIERIQRDVKYDLISADRVFEVLPSKSFIDFSKAREKELQKEQSEWFWYRSAEDLVLRRLGSRDVEEKYQKTSLDDRLFLGYSPYGDAIYTSFTKKEYEEDMAKTLAKRKK